MNALRLAFGTLTVLPVRPPGSVDRRVAGRAMLLAPLVGLVLAVLVLAALWLVEAVGASTPLAAALVVGLLALLTRAMHLDGLADTADGLGSGRPAAQALAVMRRGDVGPFGVVALVLILLVQVTALAQLLTVGVGPVALGAALVTSRLAVPLACLRGVPPARPEGLGAVVAGSVSRAAAVVAALATAAALSGLALAAESGSDALVVVAAAPAGLLGGLLVGWWAVRRLGGVTGDVLGAVVEVTFAASLVTLTLALAG